MGVGIGIAFVEVGLFTNIFGNDNKNLFTSIIIKLKQNDNFYRSIISLEYFLNKIFRSFLTFSCQVVQGN